LIRAALVSLLAGLAWAGFREYSRLGRLRQAGRSEAFSPKRFLGLGLAGGGVCLAGLLLLSLLGLAEL